LRAPNSAHTTWWPSCGNLGRAHSSRTRSCSVSISQRRLAGYPLAALAFVRASNPDDEVFVVNVADHVRLDVPMTRDVHVLGNGIARVDAIGGTALRDAVRFAERYLRKHAIHDWLHADERVPFSFVSTPQ